MQIERFLMTAFAVLALAAPAAQAAMLEPAGHSTQPAAHRAQPPAAHDAYDWGLGVLEVFGSFLILGAFMGVRRLNALTRDAQEQSLRTS